MTRLVPPSSLSLRDHHDEVCQFFQWLRHLLYNIRVSKQETFVVDFSFIREVSPGAALVLAAELDRWQQTINSKLRAYKPELWPVPTRNFLQEMGLFDLLEVSQPTGPVDARADDVTYVKYLRGEETNGELCAELLDLLSNVAERPAAENFIYDGLVEALKNVRHHAYFDDRWYGVPTGTWWMCGAYDRSSGSVVACVYDPGVGVPASLPRSGLWENIGLLLSKAGVNDDASMISAAMEAGRTRTLMDERGKGLPIMMRLFDHCPGYLRIVSGRGEAIYEGGGKITTRRHKYSLGGTLIEWTVRQPISGAIQDA